MARSAANTLNNIGRIDVTVQLVFLGFWGVVALAILVKDVFLWTRHINEPGAAKNYGMNAAMAMGWLTCMAGLGVVLWSTLRSDSSFAKTYRQVSGLSLFLPRSA